MEELALYREPVRPPRLLPRDRLETKGIRSLGHADLVALVLGSAEIAGGLVRRHGLSGLAALSFDALTREPGVGPAHAARLAAAFELSRRAQAAYEDRPRIVRPRDAWLCVRELAPLKKEHLVGLYLDAQNALVHKETISVGSLNTTRTHPREILWPAINHLALGFILAHNHPSGSLDPSDEDIAFSRSVQRAGEIVGIELYDHIIVTATGFTSLRERGAL
jgi:DNA repair protein RadC